MFGSLKRQMSRTYKNHQAQHAYLKAKQKYNNSRAYTAVPRQTSNAPRKPPPPPYSFPPHVHPIINQQNGPSTQ